MFTNCFWIYVIAWRVPYEAFLSVMVEQPRWFHYTWISLPLPLPLPLRLSQQHSNNILNTDQNIFDGFISVKWKLCVQDGKIWREDICYKSDNSIQNLIFTLRNPHSILPWQFVLKAEQKWWTIKCNSDWCVRFDSDDIHVFINSNTSSDIPFDSLYNINTYANNIAFEEFFTNVPNFNMKEIEVFEIID
jgi:hypothetical protein